MSVEMFFFAASNVLYTSTALYRPDYYTMDDMRRYSCSHICFLGNSK